MMSSRDMVIPLIAYSDCSCSIPQSELKMCTIDNCFECVHFDKYLPYFI